MTLSIIIPCYNAEPYIYELLNRLSPQVTEDVEVIVIDDGSKKPLDVSDYSFVRFIRQDNQGASAARNAGLDMATGEYIAFIDADDLVSDKYIETILNKAKKVNFDYLYLSWKAFGGWDADVKLNSIEDRFPPYNLCVWNRVYKRSMIGEIRFNTNKLVAEDAQFIREVKETGKKKAFISDYMYFYRSNSEDSLTKRAGEGKLPIKRIVYHYNAITEDMGFLLDEVKQEDQNAEVIVMTNRNDLPELENYAMVVTPRPMNGTELRGQATPLFHKIETPLKTQVLIYVAAMHAIGGIETFTYNFCKTMHKYYDITVLYDAEMHETQYLRLLPYADIVRNRTDKVIVCDTAINCRFVLPLPKNVQYKQKIQMVHTCWLKEQTTPADKDADRIIYVSDTAAKSFDVQDAEVIHNLTVPKDPVKTLILVSACRLTYEKGGQRMLDFAQMLENKGIPYVWFVFTDGFLQNAPSGMIFKRPTLDIGPYIKAADFLVALSDQESYGYSIVESWEMGTPTITTPLPVLTELGFINGKQGFTIPFDVTEAKSLEEKLYKTYKPFEYRNPNKKIVSKWREVLGDTTPTKKYKQQKGHRWVKALLDFRDMQQNRDIKAGEVYQVPIKRAEEGQKQGFFTILQ